MKARAMIGDTMRKLHAWVPVNKPSGICSVKLKEAIRLDLYHYCESVLGLSPGLITVHTFQDLEYFANGLITYRIGDGTKERVIFKISKQEHDLTIELGAERKHHSIDGELLGLSPIDHLTPATIESAVQSFFGIYEQQRCPFYKINPSGNSQTVDSQHVIPDNLSAKQYYDLISIAHLTKDTQTSVPAQKYAYARPPRLNRVEKIEILDYQRPFLSLRLQANGGLNLRQLSCDIGQRLNTKASLVRLSRTLEGPMALTDHRVLGLHELSADYYLPIVTNLRGLYRNFITMMESQAEETIQQQNDREHHCNI